MGKKLGSANGSSSCAAAAGIRSRQSWPENFCETCSVPRREAASCAQGDSSKLSSTNPMENVCSGFLCRTASAAMEVESIPPERNTPTGTSATSRFATAPSSSRSSSPAASAGETRCSEGPGTSQ